MRGNKPYGGPETSRYPERGVGMDPNHNDLGRFPVANLPYLGDNTQVFIGLMIGWISAPILNQLWRTVTRTFKIGRR